MIGRRHHTRRAGQLAATAAIATAAAGIAGLVAPAAAGANELGNNAPFQFRTPNERQVELNVENKRLREAGELGVGGGTGTIGASQGGQPLGNRTTIEVSGDNNTVNVDQDNSGNQSVESGISGNVSVGD